MWETLGIALVLLVVALVLDGLRVREATRRPWQAPRASGATADRPRSWQLSPVPSGLRAGHSSALLRGLRIGMSYSLRPQFANEA